VVVVVVVVEEEAHLLPGVAEDPLSRFVEQDDLALQEGRKEEERGKGEESTVSEEAGRTKKKGKGKKPPTFLSITTTAWHMASRISSSVCEMESGLSASVRRSIFSPLSNSTAPSNKQHTTKGDRFVFQNKNKSFK
jgi:hypothetical protein